MIKIEGIKIREFRGIREFNLAFKGKNFATAGANGTGKSGIVDAIEFVLTGTISRLSGKGAGQLSIAQHGPHVDSSGKPELAVVTLEGVIPSLGNKKFSVTRNAKFPKKKTVVPNDADVIKILEGVEKHPEFVLSRREIIQYVITSPADRAEKVKALLRLSEIENYEDIFRRIANKLDKEHKQTQVNLKSAADSLRAGLNIDALKIDMILAAVNAKRQILGLPDIPALIAVTSLKDGIVVSSPDQPTAPAITKPQATNDLNLFKARYAELGASKEFVELCTSAIAIIDEIGEEEGSSKVVDRINMLVSAKDLFDENKCPVCDTYFEEGDFVKHVQEKLERYAGISKKLKELEGKRLDIHGNIQAAVTALDVVITLAPKFPSPITVSELQTVRSTLFGQMGQLKEMGQLSELRKVLEALSEETDLATPLLKVETSISALPNRTQLDEARDFLTVADERLDKYRDARKKEKEAEDRFLRGDKIFSVYGETTKSLLKGTYEAVQEKFARYYKIVNGEDEKGFSARFLQEVGSLDLQVDFYGRGIFPPGAYHSEGHQDGMGLCLYLALMDHILGKNFTLAVLDDVVMSVDTGHRREICRLLKQEFPHTQFILTTHDEIWLNHMKTAGLIGSKDCIEFQSWNVEQGPTDWGGLDVWGQIDGHLAKNDVRAAAALLRHYLEYFFKETCNSLRATVEYKADASYGLGDTMPKGIEALGKLFGKGKAAAHSWSQKEVQDAIGQAEEKFAAAKAAVSFDKWQINSAIHFNDWDNLHRNDFEPLARAFRELVGQFQCQGCGGSFSVTPKFGTAEGVRCLCGVVNINLKPKPKEA
jgi:hypothetical protein